MFMFLLSALIGLGPCLGAIPTYRGAVYEHAAIFPKSSVTRVTRGEALEVMMKNLAVYREKTIEAALKGAKIIVFPEDGVYGTGFIRTTLEPYLEYIPDPSQSQWNPCQNPDKYPNTEVQYFLSCLARNNSIYIVANMGDRQPCSEQDAGCPHDRHYQYNTDVAFDHNGLLIARYHKMNLFMLEKLEFDTPTQTELSFFDTPFGRFGMFTCFDILFHDPAIALIETYNITDIVFPTAWMDALPLLSSIQFHSAFAAGLGVNFLAANLHRPQHGFHGSGIYTRHGALSFYYDSQSEDGRLLVSDIPILQHSLIPFKHSRSDSFKNPDVYVNTFTAKQQLDNQNEFQSYLFDDLFNFVPLDVSSGMLSVCQNNLCCHLQYNRSTGSDFFAFGVFDGLHTYQGTYYLQICTLVKCKNSSKSSCGSSTTSSSSDFESFAITGSFQGLYIYPEVLLTDKGQLRLPRIGQLEYKDHVIRGSSFDYPLLSASLFSRVYSKDREIPNDRNSLIRS